MTLEQKFAEIDAEAERFHWDIADITYYEHFPQERDDGWDLHCAEQDGQFEPACDWIVSVSHMNESRKHHLCDFHGNKWELDQLLGELADEWGDNYMLSAKKLR